MCLCMVFFLDYSVLISIMVNIDRYNHINRSSGGPQEFLRIYRKWAGVCDQKIYDLLPYRMVVKGRDNRERVPNTVPTNSKW